MLTIHFANRTERLAELLAGRVGGGALFAADEVIVPSAALRRYLTLMLARRHGVCANVRFGYLAQSQWRWIARVVPGVQAESPFAPGVLAWRILAAFDDPAFGAVHPRLHDYLAASDAVMRYQLAQQVAGVFDQYITYRPQWLEQWAAGERSVLGSGATASATADEAWQAALWRRLAGDAGEAHPAAAFVAALEAQGDALVAAGTLPAQLHVFGLPAMAPLHLGLLQALGRHIDVQVYALNPCREYWLEVVDRRRLAYLAAHEAPGAILHHEVGNGLLAAWGRQAKAQLELLIAATGDAAIDEAHFDEPEGGSLLAHVQRSILDLTELAPGSIALADDDRSIEIHVCHGLARELEVLHDRLLALFATPNPPAPADILVVTPDLESAAPLIDAVFATAPPDRRIPYHVTGRARSSANPAARALLDLLALAASRVTASAVFALLEQSLVARRLDLDAEGLALIRGWLQDAGVAWALDAEHRASFGLPAQPAHSFADGLDRLYLGYALPARVDAPFDAKLPAGDAEGSDAVALGALWRFVERLAALRRRVAAPLAACDWPALLVELLHDFLTPGDDEREDLLETQAAIERFAQELNRATPDHPVSLDIVRAALADTLDDPARGGVPTGGVTFASMSSLRGVPYNVICAIGLNDGAFPTQARPAEYDLLSRDPRPGDRQRRIDERNLFLDLLLTAREQFYLSYTGRSVRDNAPLPPSTLVSDLLETLLPAIAGDRDEARERLVVAHPLQGFSELAFRDDSDPRLRSFDAETADALRRRIAALRDAAARNTPPAATPGIEGDDGDASDDDAPEALSPFFAAPLASPGDEWCDLALADLIGFFANPCRYLLKRRLRIVLAKAEDELQDDEPFIAGLPARNALAAQLLPGLRAGHSVAAARALALAGTAVPAGAFGRHFLDRELAALDAFATRLNALTAEPLQPPHAAQAGFDAGGRRWRIHAGFADLRGGGLVRHRYDALRARDALDAWLHHLLLSADTPPGVAPRTTWLAHDETIVLRPVDSARDVLRDLALLYERGLQEPLYFFPKTAWAYMVNDKNAAKATSAWKATDQHPHAESADPAYRLALRGLPDPMGDGFGEFERCANAVFAPLLAHVAEGLK